MRRYAFAARPGWIAGHVVVLALCVTMVFLGRWQLDVSDAKGFDLQNFGYSLQWWAFTAFGLFFWGRILRDRARKGPRTPADVRRERAEAIAAEAAPVAYRRYVMPSSAPSPSDDVVRTAYNDYLAGLAAGDADRAVEQFKAEDGR